MAIWKLLLVTLGGLAVLAAGGLAGYERLAESRLPPPPGRLVDIGGYRLRIECTGAGTPTVILEAGLGDAGISWSEVQPTLARSTRVCSYDRAGFGWSEAGPYPRDPLHETTELHTLLAKAGLQPPYVLVGHSYGADLARLYASRFHEQLAGLVLVEASNQDQWSRLPALDSTWYEYRAACHGDGWRGRFGLLRLRHDSIPYYAPAVRPIAESFSYTPREAIANCGEIEAILGVGRQQLSSVRSLGELPLAIISAGKNFFGDLGNGRVWAVWQVLQASDTLLAPRATRVISPQSGHQVQHDDPALVTAQVQAMLARLARR